MSRSLTLTWQDPMPLAQAARSMSGIDFLRAVRDGQLAPAPIQELRDLTRTRKQLVGEIARHTLRIQKTLEDANLKLTQVVTAALAKGSAHDRQRELVRASLLCR